MNTNQGVQIEQSRESFDVEKVEEKLKNVKTLADLTGPDGIIQNLVKNTIERILLNEQEKMLGYRPHENTEDIYGSNRS